MQTKICIVLHLLYKQHRKIKGYIGTRLSPNLKEQVIYIITWIKKKLPEDTELVFLFAEPTAPMPQAKRRKDGTKRTHSEWAEANGFRWYSSHSIPKDWIDVESEVEEDPEYVLEVE